jgi:hypothetical protein
MQPDLAIAELTRSLAAGTPVYAVHYACEGFSKPLDRPLRVSAIAVKPIPAGSDLLFSITDSPSATEAESLESEKKLLSSFNDWLAAHSDAGLVHWDMDAAVYGFMPIAKRFAYLTGAGHTPVAHPEDRLFNLDRLLAHRYGAQYVAHPRLATLLALNGISTRYSLTGSDQAERFERGDHASLSRCAAEQASHLAQLTQLFVSGQLQTERSGPLVHFADQLIDSLGVVAGLAGRMDLVAAALRVRHGNRPGFDLSDEYDYQDLAGALLRVFFEDVRREEYIPSYAGGASRVDFMLRDVGFAVEIKLASRTLRAKEIGEELLVDIGRYRTLPGIRHLVCLVFDAGHNVENPRGLERDLTGTSNGLPVTVRVMD